jgi:predicted NBD/HSP70 family sugar kinase
MASKKSPPASAEGATLPTHGACSLPSVEIDSYSLELEDQEGFAGDKANKAAFAQILDELRKPLARLGEDPFGNKSSDKISRKKLATILSEGDPQAAALVQSAVEQFAQQLQAVIRRFLKLKSWRDTEAIVVGGGFRGSRIGELAIARAGVLLKTEGLKIDLQLIEHDPDEAGLIGAAHLLPSWMVEGHDGILAADIGGTNIRVGLVELNLAKAADLSKARVIEYKHWCHEDEGPLSREETVDQLVSLLASCSAQAKKAGLHLAPLVGVGCPGIILEDGSIERGAQNLPGDWESSKFNLPRSIRERLPRVGEHETNVVLHNDAVVQGLSEIPSMQERQHWGILTIGTGLGNARFSNRASGQGTRTSSVPQKRRE